MKKNKYRNELLDFITTIIKRKYESLENSLNSLMSVYYKTHKLKLRFDVLIYGF